MYNKIILIANLTKDPELRYTPQGTPVASFRIAANTRYKQDGEIKQEELFIDTVVFGKQAEACSKFLSKGSPVLVDGRLKEEKWESDGQQKSKFKIIANDVRFLPSNKKGGGQSDAISGVDGPVEGVTDLDPF